MVRFRRCIRASGHGPGGAYCKQHARKHEPLAVAKLTIWFRAVRVYNLEGALPQPVKVREATEKTYIDERGTRHPMRDSDGRFYISEHEALADAERKALSMIEYARSQEKVACEALSKIGERQRLLKKGTKAK